MRLESIVAGMDFSDTAIKGVRWVTEYFAPNAAMTLVNVIPPLDQPAFAGHLMPSTEAFEAVAREYAETHLHDIADTLPADIVRRDIRVGKPDAEITTLARDTGADLVVIGPHADRPRPRKFLGTTAERVVRTSPVPVLVATNPPAGRPRRMLVPIDDSAITPDILKWVRDLAAAFDADVTLLHVWSNAVYSDVASMSYATTKSEDAAQREINKELRDSALQWLDKLARTGIAAARVTAMVTYGKPGDAALETATAISAELIILGRRGSGLVAPALLGSTVGTVLHGATCPVLVIAGASDSDRKNR